MRYKKICTSLSLLVVTATFLGCSPDKKELNTNETFQNEEIIESLGNNELQTYTVYDEYGNMGLIDENGNIVIELSYNHISPFQKDLAIFRKYENYGVINRNKEIFLEPIYMSITNLGDGYFNAKPDEYTDYIYDSNGKLILETTNSSIEYLGDEFICHKK
ncbi:WG repeat-containing protein [Clostridium perfringens]|nr:WG repeat-containing protein [Clostridium perfringens]